MMGTWDFLWSSFYFSVCLKMSIKKNKKQKLNNSNMAGLTGLSAEPVSSSREVTLSFNAENIHSQEDCHLNAWRP